jgi:hypothetical protein
VLGRSWNRKIASLTHESFEFNRALAAKEKVKAPVKTKAR